MSAKWILITGLAYVFAIFGIGKFVQPLLWIGWIPLWMEGVLTFTRDQWLNVFGAVEVVLAVLLLIPKKKIQRVAVILMALHLVAVITQSGLLNDIGVRDTGLLLMAVGLFVLL